MWAAHCAVPGKPTFDALQCHRVAAFRAVCMRLCVCHREDAALACFAGAEGAGAGNSRAGLLDASAPAWFFGKLHQFVHIAAKLSEQLVDPRLAFFGVVPVDAHALAFHLRSTVDDQHLPVW
jgi:hypothetical protein